MRWRSSASSRHYDLSGKTAFVTGGARGIGYAIGRELHSRGARIVLVDVDALTVEQAAASISQEEAMGIVADVRDPRMLEAAVRIAVERFGSLDVVVANAGIAPPAPGTVHTTEQQVFERILDVNLRGVWQTLQVTLPLVIARRGHVLLTSSVFAFVNGAANAPYAVTKAGVEALGRALRTELVPFGATAGVLYPGWVDTRLVHDAVDSDPIAVRMVNELFPRALSRRISPDEVASAAVLGIERRAARTIVPRRWLPLSVLRGLTNPLLDWTLEHNASLRRVMHEIEDGQGRPH